jgi:hypothetical protein
MIFQLFFARSANLLDLTVRQVIELVIDDILIENRGRNFFTE